MSADLPLLASPDTLAHARRVVAVAFGDGQITAYERGVLDHNLEESPAVDSVRLSRAREIVADLWLLAHPSTHLSREALKFLTATAPTRGGVFEELDRSFVEEEEEASRSPRADSAAVVVARVHVRRAFERSDITENELAMLLEQLEGDRVTESDLATVNAQLAARARSARLGAGAAKGRGTARLEHITGAAGAPK